MIILLSFIEFHCDEIRETGLFIDFRDYIAQDACLQLTVTAVKSLVWVMLVYNQATT